VPCSRRSPRDILREGNARAPQLDRPSDIAAGPVPFAGPIPGLVLHRFRIRACRMQLAGFSRRRARRLRARGQATLDNSLGGMLELMNSS
jgi:hypothetical protein